MRGSVERGTADRRVGQKGLQARVLVFLSLSPTLFAFFLSLCTSLVVPPAATDTSSGGCLSLPPIFGIISAVHTLARLGIWDVGLLSSFLSHSKSRSGTVMNGVKDSA